MKRRNSQCGSNVMNRLRAVEQLEARRLFSTDLAQVLVKTESDAMASVEATPLVGSLPFVREGILGSGIASVEGDMPVIATVGGVSGVTFVAEAGTTTSFVITPTTNAAVLTVSVLQSNGAVAAGPFVAPAPGAAVAIQPMNLASGSYSLSVTSTAATPVKLKAARNAAIEDQIGDTTPTNELRIDSSYQDFGGSGAFGVLGQAEVGLVLSKVSNSTFFVDISSSGTVLNLSDDQEATIVTTIGNSLFPAGNVTVSNNGAIIAASAFDLNYTNIPLSNLSHGFPTALLPFWDDINGGQGAVYWKEQTIGGIPTLIVQWENRPHFSGGGSATFQVQLYATGPVLARFVYEDVVFGDPRYDFGGSATVGVVSRSERSQFSFNRASLANNDAIEIRSRGAVEVDEYEFRGAAGQTVYVAFDVIGQVAASDTVVELFRGGTLLATATNDPISDNLTIANFDVGILGFRLPDNAIYTVRMSSRSTFRYYLSVTLNAALDIENAGGSEYPARTIAGIPGTMMGSLNANDDVDVGFIQLNAGSSVRLILTRTGDASGYLPATTIVPKISVRTPELSTIASTSTFNDNGEMILDFVAPESGRHRIFVRQLRGVGEYVLKVLRGVAAVAPALAETPDGSGTVTTSTPSNQPPFGLPLQVLLDMNGDGELSPIDALLVINRLNQRVLNRDAVPAIIPQDNEEELARDLYFDTSGDGLLSPLDALQVINRLNKRRV